MLHLNFSSLFLVVPCFALFIYFWLKKRKLLPLFVIFVAIIVPKISVIGFSSNYHTGIRVEDLLILGYCLVLAIEKFKNVKDIFKSKLFIAFVIYMSILAISLATGVFKARQYSLFGGILSYVRRAEYFCFIFAGFDFYKQNKDNFMFYIRWVLLITLILNFVVGILQCMGILGAINQGDYIMMGVAVGLFNGAYEIAAFCNLVLAVFMYDLVKNRNFTITNIIAIIFSIILILLSKSRISLIATVALIGFITFVHSNKKVRIISLIAAPILCVGLVLVIRFNLIPVFSRFSTLNFDGLFNSISHYAKHATYEEYLYVVQNEISMEGYVISSGDISFNVRIFKWFSAIDLFKSFPLFGYGFSATGTLDGNYVKMLCETGIIGLAAFVSLFIVALFTRSERKSDVTVISRWIFLSVAIGALLIDMFEASKIMEPLWFFIGASLADRFFKVEKLYDKEKSLLPVAQKRKKGKMDSADSQAGRKNFKEKNNKKKEILNVNKKSEIDNEELDPEALKNAKKFIEMNALANSMKLKKQENMLKEMEINARNNMINMMRYNPYLKHFFPPVYMNGNFVGAYPNGLYSNHLRFYPMGVHHNGNLINRPFTNGFYMPNIPGYPNGAYPRIYPLNGVNGLSLNNMYINAMYVNAMYANGIYPNGMPLAGYPNGIYTNGSYPPNMTNYLNGVYPQGYNPYGTNHNTQNPNRRNNRNGRKKNRLTTSNNDNDNDNDNNNNDNDDELEQGM